MFLLHNDFDMTEDIKEFIRNNVFELTGERVMFCPKVLGRVEHIRVRNEEPLTPEEAQTLMSEVREIRTAMKNFCVRVMQGTGKDAEIAALPNVLALLLEDERMEQREACLRCGAAQ